VCFLAGNMALGWHFQRNLTYLLDMAKELTKTCYQMYAKQATGLSPEIAYFNVEPQINQETISVRVRRRRSIAFSHRLLMFSLLQDNDAHNLLRPELVESLYYMYCLTGDEIYQDWGWTIFQSFEKYTRQVDGYSSINDVRNKDNVRPRDKMESFFLAETLKYFYLLFAEKNLFPFDQWIFNTEAHPLPIYRH
jgi:endoplasmic reticulum Man9GlcNAc2 1,2-alpha-mannosidase